MGQRTRHVMNDVTCTRHVMNVDVTGARHVMNVDVAGPRYVEGTCCYVAELSEG